MLAINDVRHGSIFKSPHIGESLSKVFGKGRAMVGNLQRLGPHDTPITVTMGALMLREIL